MQTGSEKETHWTWTRKTQVRWTFLSLVRGIRQQKHKRAQRKRLKHPWKFTLHYFSPSWLGYDSKWDSQTLAHDKCNELRYDYEKKGGWNWIKFIHMCVPNFSPSFIYPPSKYFSLSPLGIYQWPKAPILGSFGNTWTQNIRPPCRTTAAKMEQGKGIRQHTRQPVNQRPLYIFNVG